MGFSAGIYVYPKYKDVKPEQLEVIEHMIAYENEDWAKENFDTVFDYVKHWMDGNAYVIPDEDTIDFYKNHQIESEYGSKYLFKEYAYWGSNGSGDVYEFISKLGKKSMRGRKILSKEDIGKIFNFCLEKYLEFLPVPCNVAYSFNYLEDEDGEMSENPEIKLTPCDGIEVRFLDDNTIKRMDTNYFNEECFCLPKHYFDEWTLSAYLEGIRSCAKILSEVDFENSIIEYSGGW